MGWVLVGLRWAASGFCSRGREGQALQWSLRLGCGWAETAHPAFRGACPARHAILGRMWQKTAWAWAREPTRKSRKEDVRLPHMDGWSVVLLAAACYVAVMALVRLMRKRRDQMIERFREEVEKEKKLKEAERKREAFQNPGRKSA